MPEKIESALTAEERLESEIESHYGRAATSFQVDHNGRVFARSEGHECNCLVVLNEGADASVVLPKIMALCNEWAAETGQPFGFTRADVELLTGLADEAVRAIADLDYYMGGRMEAPDPDAFRALATRIAALLPPENDARR